MERTLLLNATYEPLQVVSWKRAIRLLFQEKAEMLERYSGEIRSLHLTVPVPSVIRLRHFVRVHRFHNQIRFSRTNLFARDRYRCQYCGTRMSVTQLTYDHVIPVARGGRKNWENIVTSCVPCNRRKGDRTPEEAGMTLLRHPSAPHSFPVRVQLLFHRVQTPESWRSYIYL
jgi:5-methylcytosine-specific restriction endonuclease McrA